MRYVSFRKCLAVLIVLVLVATGLWAAGAEEEPAAAADKKYVTDPSTGKVVTAPEYGGTLTFNLSGLAGSIDPFFGWPNAGPTDGVVEKLGIMNWAVDRDVWDLKTLFTPVTYMRGRLAESWDISPDGLTYTFHIRDGIRWHDKAPMNGRELTAHDIEYNFHRILGMGDFSEAGATPFGGAGPLKNIPWESIAATDDATVVMKLTEPRLDFLRVVLMSEVTSIMPPEVIEQHGDVQDWRNLVGTGPFILTDYVEDSQITWAKNPDYWGYDEKYPENRLPYVDELRAMIIPEQGSVQAALRSGKLDFRTWNTSVDSAESIQKTNPEIAVHTLWFRSQDSFMPNMYKPPFSDINVRRAMQMALDNETAAATLWKGFADPTPQGRVGIPGYYIPFEQWDEEVKQYYRYDPEAAEKLLDEAGYPRGADGTRFKTTLNHGSQYGNLDYAEVAVSYWAEIGVEVEIELLTGAEMNEKLGGPNQDGLWTTIAGNAFDPVMVVGWYHTDAVQSAGIPHLAEWPELDVMVDAALSARSIEEQQRLIAEADEYAMSRHWLIWAPKGPVYYMAQPWVVGYSGEVGSSLASGENQLLFARFWIDSALKKEMGH